MTTQYKTFCISDVFSVKHVQKLKLPGRAYVMDKDIISEDGKTPYIAAISRNNGITGYSNYMPNNKGDCITLSTTADSSNTVFYQEDDFIGRQQIAEIRRKDGKPLGKQCGLYIATVIRGLTRQFNYVNKLTIDYLQQAMVSLPVTEAGTPDWRYMQEFIAGLEKDRIVDLEQEGVAELEQYLVATGLNDYALTDEELKTLSLSDSQGDEAENSSTVSGAPKEMREFKIADVFDLHKGQRLTKADQLPGDTPFIGSTENNNGATRYIGQKPIFTGNAITVSYNGSVGQVFYQEHPFWASDDVNVLYLKNHKLDRELFGYLGASLYRAGKAFSYTFKWNLARMRDTMLMLPIQTDTSGQPIIDPDYTYHPDGFMPDWKYMTEYIRAIEKLIIKDIVKFNAKRLKLMRTVMANAD